jgi:hypothetical protein
MRSNFWIRIFPPPHLVAPVVSGGAEVHISVVGIVRAGSGFERKRGGVDSITCPAGVFQRYGTMLGDAVVSVVMKSLTPSLSTSKTVAEICCPGVRRWKVATRPSCIC